MLQKLIKILIQNKYSKISFQNRDLILYLFLLISQQTSLLLITEEINEIIPVRFTDSSSDILIVEKRFKLDMTDIMKNYMFIVIFDVYLDRFMVEFLCKFCLLQEITLVLCSRNDENDVFEEHNGEIFLFGLHFNINDL